MKKTLKIIFTILFILVPSVALADWVDVDRSGKESTFVIDTGEEDMGASLDIDSSGYPHIAWYGWNGVDLDDGDLFYLYWNGSAWVDADGEGQESALVYAGGDTAAISPSLKLDSNDRPNIAFAYGDNPTPADIYFLRWDGSSWVDANGSDQNDINVSNTGTGNQPSLYLNNSDYPRIVWHEGTVGGDIYYLQWNGSAWVDADGTDKESIDIGDGQSPNLHLNSGGLPCVAWQYWDIFASDIYYLCFDGSGWVDADGTGQGNINISNTGTAISGPSLKINYSDYPLIAWGDNDPGNYDIYYLAWDGTAWVDADGTDQESINISSDAGTSNNPSLGLNYALNYPCLSWADDTLDIGNNYAIYYLYHNQGGWIDAGGNSLRTNINIYSENQDSSTAPSLVVTPDRNYPHIAFSNDARGDRDIYYLEWWTPLPQDITDLPQTGYKLTSYINSLLLGTKS